MEQRTLAGGTTEPDSSGYIMGEHSMKSWDGTEIFYRSWQRGLAKGQAVILFHGGHEHSGRFQDLIERLDLRQVSFFAWDARGHGRSAGKRGYARHFHDFIRDADGFIQHVSTRYKIPIENMAFLGHSVGSVIISAWLHDYARQIRGASQVQGCCGQTEQFSFCAERGCVVPTSRSTSAQYQAVLFVPALRLELRTQPRSAK